MSENYQLKNNTKNQLALSEKRNEIINNTPEKALDLLLSSQTPASLIQSFPEEDLFFLIHHIGLEDSIPILALASSEQWGYILDIEIWEKDRLENTTITAWLKLLLNSDKKRTLRWLLNERLEFIELYISNNIEVIIREENQDPSDFPDDFFTFDDYFYIRIIETRSWHTSNLENSKETNEERYTIIRDFIETLVSLEITLYQKVMLESLSVIPSEIEEEEYRMRGVRLAEKGFLSFDEALEIYSPFTLKDMNIKADKKANRRKTDTEIISAPATYITEIKVSNHFTNALKLIETESDFHLLQSEFASLCNQIISADQSKIKEKKSLEGVVSKACGYISLGLEILSGGNSNISSYSMESLILRYPLKDIFKLGYTPVADLKYRAEKIQEESWFKEKDLPLTFWGEKWVGVLGGLLVNRPLFFDNYKTGLLYREFSSLDDISVTEKAIETIKNFDNLLSMIAPDVEVFSENFLTVYNLLLTLWINNIDGIAIENAKPVELQNLKTFFETLWESGKRDFNNPGKIKDSMKTNFLTWIATQSGFSNLEISDRLSSGLEAMFDEIENEYSTVQSSDLDPKYIHLFLCK